MTKKKKVSKKKETQELEEIDFDIDFDNDEEPQKEVMVHAVDGVELPSAWAQSLTNMQEVTRARQSFNLRHGMFANVPMICKGSQCPSNALCHIPIRKRPTLKRCPIEIGFLVDRYDKLCQELEVGPEDYFDQGQIKDLVDIELKLIRANGQLAIAGHFIEDVVAAVDDKGNEITRPELHKATEYEERLLSRKSKILADLRATRKSKKEGDKLGEASSFAADLMRRAMKAKQGRSIIDVTPSEDSVSNDTLKGDE